MGRFIAALIVFLFPISVLSLADEASFPLDAALRWEGERHGTLGPTGRRIFADRLDCAPGFRGVFGYGGATDGFSNVMVLFFREPKWGQLFLTHEHTVWYPSHNEVFWKHDRIRVLERKCITDDDMLLDRIEIENRSDTSIDLEIQLLGNLTPEPARFLSKQIPLDLTKAANVIPLSDGTFALPGPEDSIIWPYRLPIQKDASTKPFPFQGGQVIDGIHYALAAPDTGEAPTLTALRCDQNEASRTLPEKIFLEVPDVKPAIAHLHLLCMHLPDHFEAIPATPAMFRVKLDDGSQEEIAWPAAPEVIFRDKSEVFTTPDFKAPHREHWIIPSGPFETPGILIQLSYTPPPGRFIRGLAMEKNSDVPLDLPVLIAATLEIPPPQGRPPALLGAPDFHGQPVHFALLGEGFSPKVATWDRRSLLKRLTLPAGGRTAFNVLLASGPKRFMTVLAGQERAGDDQAFEKHLKKYHAWFEEQAPQFSCSDPFMERVWRYRWFLARHNMMRLDLPDFTLPVFFESLHDPSAGWITTFSTPYILSEVRWLADQRFAQGQVRALLMKQRDDGLLPNLSIKGREGFCTTHWIPAAAIDAYRVNASRQYLMEILSLLGKNVIGRLERYDRDQDYLPEVTVADDTGMPWLPSLRLFRKTRADETRSMERPEFAAGLHASAMAVAEGYRMLENPEEEARFVDLAARIEQAVLDKMWHDEEGFFYPLWAADDCPIPCREITGFFPFFCRLVPDDPAYLDAMELLLDPIMNPLGGFRSPAVTIAKPPGWHERIFPHDLSVVVECLSNMLRYYTPPDDTKSAISDLLRAYTKLHFHEGEPGWVGLRRSYNIEHRTMRGELDVFQSTYNDLIIRYVAGLVPRMDDVIELWPLVDDLDHFRLEGVIYHGRRLDITWDKPDGKTFYPPTPEGFSLHVDGEMQFNEPVLMRKLHALNEAKH